MLYYYSIKNFLNSFYNLSFPKTKYVCFVPRPYRGSVISWSRVTYSVRGKVLLENTYEQQGKQLVSRRGRGRQLKGEKKSRRFFKERRNNEIERR